MSFSFLSDRPSDKKWSDKNEQPEEFQSVVLQAVQPQRLSFEGTNVDDSTSPDRDDILNAVGASRRFGGRESGGE